MKKVISITFLLVLTNVINAQGYFNQWYFGNGASIDFNNGFPEVINNGSLHTVEGCASISDYEGNLLFYTDGDTVWTRNHVPMPNGIGLMGHWSSTQSALIVPMPGNSLKYYVFTMQDWMSSGDLRYSIVDMALNNGFGDIVVPTKNTLLGSNFTEKLVAAAGNCGVWVITHKRNNSDFHAFFIDVNGIGDPVISSVGSAHISTGNPNGLTGSMKVSPNNQKIALATLNQIVELFDFNAISGIISNAIALTVNSNAQPWGVCFSPNSELLYVGEGMSSSSSLNTVYQYNTTSGIQSTIIASKTSVGNPATPVIIVFDLQLGPDNKMYVAKQGTNFLDVINDPNNLGGLCNYVSDAINLGVNKVRVGLPNALKFPNNSIIVNLGNDTILCQEQSISLDAGPATSYLWSDGSIGSTFSVSNSGTYWVQASNGQCSSRDSINITYNSYPILNLGNDTTLCQGQAITLDAGSAALHLWSNGSVSPSLNVSTSGVYWVQASNDNCSVADTIAISINEYPDVNLGNDTILCQGQSMTLNVGFATSYLWSNGSITSSINVSGSGDYWVEASNDQCSATDTIAISINQYPNVDLGNDTTLCQGQTITLNGGSATSYLWSNGSILPSINVSASGTYWLQASNGQCSSRDTIIIEYNSLPTLHLGNDTILCQGQTITLDAGTAVSYLWSNSSTTSFINVSTSGEYWVQLSNGQCSITDTIAISINQYPIVNLGNDTTLCQGQMIMLNGGSATSYLWSNSSTTSFLNVSTSGEYWVQLSNGQCSVTDTITISINQYPIVELGNDTTLCQGQTITLNGGSASSYFWSDGSTAPSINVSTSGIYWVQARNGQCFRTDSLFINISLCEIEFELPNVFTPNKDGFNDDFIPIEYKGITKSTLKIYNRWGEEVFYTDDLLHGWDGYYKEKICSDGTYFWVAQYTTILNESKELNGFLTLVK